MRIAELSRRSGIPVPTIKYYLREGLLPPGELSSRNQASYDEGHIRRLRLVRALLEIGRLPIATIKSVLSELDTPEPNLHHAMGRALRGSIASEPGPEGDREVETLIERRGWSVSPEAPARRAVADVIAAMHQLGWDSMLAQIDGYAEIADRAARLDMEVLARHSEPDEIVYSAVVGTILGDALIAGLRRLAQENASAQMYRRDGEPTPAATRECR
ncbi:MerR family transcriptional regulator [Allorhizocola rhizosphaerae]|uniref:MerR family transcriptional regulator n=1 Tax=Allorhizocola rhizosphaerae TaxID=1872709 RepID=UPI000E3C44C6|nr:MerR family transcriptional regulator [Allorhizocola rhizosphaerae]